MMRLLIFKIQRRDQSKFGTMLKVPLFGVSGNATRNCLKLFSHISISAAP
jgi:hypothetical protein